MSNTESNESKEKAAVELSRMITELNEVRMRLDSVVRKIGDSAGDAAEVGEQVESLDQLRLRMVDQLDRIREKLVVRARSLDQV